MRIESGQRRTDDYPLKRNEIAMITDYPFVFRAIIGGFLLCHVGCSKPAQSGGPPTPTVTVSKPLVKKVVEWDEYVGRLEALSTVEVRPRVEGFIKSSLFEEGQIVQKGQLLFQIDDRPFEAAVQRAQAALQSAQAAQSAAVAQQTGAKAAQMRAEEVLALANDRFGRAQQLARTNNISDEEYQQRISEQRQAEAGKNSAIAEYEAAVASVAAADAAIETARAMLRTAEIDLGFTRVTAPITGRIGRRLVTAGNLVSGGAAGSTLLTTIVSLDPIHCYFEADEAAFLKYMRLSNSGRRPSSREFKNPAFLAIADEKGFPHAGHMDFVDNRISMETGSVLGRAIFSNETNDLTPGLFARVRIPGSDSHDALLIPDSAISTDQTSRIVLTIDAEGKVLPKPIKLGPIVDGLRVVREGITADDRIILTGMQMAFPGSQPKVVDGEIKEGEDDGMPSEVEPWPREKWLSALSVSGQAELTDDAASSLKPDQSTPQPVKSGDGR